MLKILRYAQDDSAVLNGHIAQDDSVVQYDHVVLNDSAVPDENRVRTKR